MHTRSKVLGSLALVGLLTLSPAARAQEPEPTVVVLVESSDSPLSQRLRLEIESLGLRVKWGSSETTPVQPLEGEARAAGAIAAIRVTQVGGGAVEMTILDRVTGKTVHRSLVVSTPADPAAAELIATRTVELLRASLMELASPHPPRGEVPITPEVRALARPPAAPAPRLWPKLSFAAGPAVVYSPPWSLGGHLLAGLTWMSARRFGVEASVLVPLVPERLRRQEGEAELALTLYRLGGVLRFGAGSTFSLQGTAGVALGTQALSGSATAPYGNARDTLWFWSGYAGAGAGWHATSGFALRLDLSAGLAYPHTIVRFAGRETADWGRPWASGSLAAELSWP